MERYFLMVALMIIHVEEKKVGENFPLRRRVSEKKLAFLTNRSRIYNGMLLLSLFLKLMRLESLPPIVISKFHARNTSLSAVATIQH